MGENSPSNLAQSGMKYYYQYFIYENNALEVAPSVKTNIVGDSHKCQNKVVNVKAKNVKQQQFHYFLPTLILM